MFAIYNVLGHLLYSSLYAALGAAFNSARRSAALQSHPNAAFAILRYRGVVSIRPCRFRTRNRAVTAPPSAPVMMSMRIAVGARANRPLAPVDGRVHLRCIGVFGTSASSRHPDVRQEANFARNRPLAPLRVINLSLPWVGLAAA